MTTGEKSKMIMELVSQRESDKQRADAANNLNESLLTKLDKLTESLNQSNTIKMRQTTFPSNRFIIIDWLIVESLRGVRDRYCNFS